MRPMTNVYGAEFVAICKYTQILRSMMDSFCLKKKIDKKKKNLTKRKKIRLKSIKSRYKTFTRYENFTRYKNLTKRYKTDT